MEGIRRLIDILLWFWGVIAYQVNYREYSWLDDIEYALWGDWYWGQRNAEKSDMTAPWNTYGDF